MASMVRKQAYITPDQERALKQRARELGVTEAQLIRAGLDHLGRTQNAREAAPARTAPRVRDRRAWEAALAIMEQRAALTVPQTKRTWTREEIDDDHRQRRLRRSTE